MYGGGEEAFIGIAGAEYPFFLLILGFFLVPLHVIAHYTNMNTVKYHTHQFTPILAYDYLPYIPTPLLLWVMEAIGSALPSANKTGN